MKTALFMIGSAAAVSAAAVTTQTGSELAKSMCKKEGEAYCLGGSNILRCEGQGKGYADQCTVNLSGYPPAGGIASCYEKTKGDNKAACQKNCIVHADPSFTLPPDECAPSVNRVNPTPIQASNYTEPLQTPITAFANKNTISGMVVAGLVAAYIL